MQGQRSCLKFFPDITGPMNQGSDSNTMQRSAPRGNLRNPVESRLSEYGLSSSGGNNNLPDPPSNDGRSFDGWCPGESSSSANSQNRLFGRELKVEHEWSSSASSCVVAEPSAVDWRYEPRNVPARASNSSGFGGSYMHRNLNIGASLTLDSVNEETNHGYINPTSESSHTAGKGLSSHINQPGGSETQHFSTAHMGENGTEFSSSSSPWGSSGKRKAFEGSSGQSSIYQSLNLNPQDEDVGNHSVPAHLNASSSSHVLSPRNGVGIGQEALNGFPPTSVTEVAERSQRNFGIEASSGQQESVQCDMSVPGVDTRHDFLRRAGYPPRPVRTNDPSDQASIFSGTMPLNHRSNQSQSVQHPGSRRNTNPYSRNEFFGSRNTSTFDPLFYSTQVEAAARSFPSTREHSYLGSLAEARHTFLESPDWSFVPPANSSSYRSVPSSSHADPSPSSRSGPNVWINHQNPTTHPQPRFPEWSPWTRFPPVEPASGGQRGHFPTFPSGTSSSVEPVMPSGSSSGAHQHRSHPHSFWRDVSHDDINGWRALAAHSEGRERLISEIIIKFTEQVRQVLTAMWGDENTGPEDFNQVFDPLFGAMPDLHDRHRDMRLDVDNMSYEELLALEEQIGDVNTGLSEDAVMGLMKQRKYELVMRESSSNPEPCCVCREDYIVGDDIGGLDCGHEFHTDCIKQWLMLKNLCPICKMTALRP